MKRYKTSTIIIAVVGFVLFISIVAPIVLIMSGGFYYVDQMWAMIFSTSQSLSAVSILVLILIILVCVVANRFFGKSYRLKIPLILLIVMVAFYLILIPIVNLFPIVMHDMPPLQLPPDIPPDYFERMQNK